MLVMMKLLFLLSLFQVAVGWDYKCTFCKWGAGAIISYNQRGYNRQKVLNMVSEACYTMGLYPREVCQGMVNNVGARLFDILDLTDNSLTSGDICGMLLGSTCSSVCFTKHHLAPRHA